MCEKICCVTGHRTIPEEKQRDLKCALHNMVLQAIAEGYTHFISGFAAGADLLFAEIVVGLKAQYPIALEAAIPYPGRMKTPDETFQRLIRCCDVVQIHSQQYTTACYAVRNRYMVQQASLVLAVCDGRQTGGTAMTMRYARQNNKILRSIEL